MSLCPLYCSSHRQSAGRKTIFLDKPGSHLSFSVVLFVTQSLYSTGHRHIYQRSAWLLDHYIVYFFQNRFFVALSIHKPGGLTIDGAVSDCYRTMNYERNIASHADDHKINVFRTHRYDFQYNTGLKFRYNFFFQTIIFERKNYSSPKEKPQHHFHHQSKPLKNYSLIICLCQFYCSSHRQTGGRKPSFVITVARHLALSVLVHVHKQTDGILDSVIGLARYLSLSVILLAPHFQLMYVSRSVCL